MFLSRVKFSSNVRKSKINIITQIKNGMIRLPEHYTFKLFNMKQTFGNNIKVEILGATC